MYQRSYKHENSMFFLIKCDSLPPFLFSFLYSFLSYIPPPSFYDYKPVIYSTLSSVLPSIMGNFEWCIHDTFFVRVISVYILRIQCQISFACIVILEIYFFIFIF